MLHRTLGAAALAAIACGNQPPEARRSSGAAAAPPVAPAGSAASTDGATDGRAPEIPETVAAWLQQKQRRFEGSVRAWRGAPTPTPYTVSLAEGFALHASSDLDATYVMGAKGVADGVMVSITMDVGSPDLDAAVARASTYRRRVTKKEQRAGGFVLDAEDEAGAITVEVAIPVHGETMICTVSLYTTQHLDELVPWAESMCSSLRSR